MKLPPEHVGWLKAAWEESKHRVGVGQVEPFEVLQAVEAHRWYWKPESKIRLLLIAESHVYSPSGIKLNVAALKGLLPTALDQFPEQYCRVVYCLGSGEDWLLDTAYAKGTPGSVRWRSRNASVWQFWDMLTTFATDEGAKPTLIRRNAGNADQDWAKFSAPSDVDRIRTRIETLNALKARGIWLVDAAAHALYDLPTAAGGKPKPSRKDMDDCHDDWWRHCGRNLMHHSEPEAVLFVGKCVHDALQKRVSESLQSVPIDYINQPNTWGATLESNIGLWTRKRRELLI